MKTRLHDPVKVKERETFIKENFLIMKGTEIGKTLNITRARVSQIVKKLGLTGMLFIPLLVNSQDTSMVKFQSGTYVFVNGSDSILIISPSATDTVFTNEILIAQSNSGSALIKKKVKWIRMIVTGETWYIVDNTGAKVDVVKWKNPKNNRWIDP